MVVQFNVAKYTITHIFKMYSVKLQSWLIHYCIWFTLFFFITCHLILIVPLIRTLFMLYLGCNYDLNAGFWSTVRKIGTTSVCTATFSRRVLLQTYRNVNWVSIKFACTGNETDFVTMSSRFDLDSDEENMELNLVYVI